MLMKRNYVALLLVTCVYIFTLIGCQSSKIPQSTANSDNSVYYTFTDALGNTVILKEKPKRVISLMGSYAETWLLAGGELIGATEDVINERKMQVPEGTEIIGTVKEPNVEKILLLSPDFILLSSDIEKHVEVSKTFEKAGISYAFFKVEYFEDYLHMLDICTDITGNKAMYEKNGIAVQKKIEDILCEFKSIYPPTVLVIRAFSKGAQALADDHMVCKMLEDLGAINIATKHKSLLEELSMEEIIEEDPDFIFVVTMGDSDKAIEALKNGVAKNPAWNNLSAVKNDRYIILPKELFHYKPNARWSESYEYLAQILYPQNK